MAWKAGYLKGNWSSGRLHYAFPVAPAARRGSPTLEIASITGHTHAYIDEIIDTYASRTRALSQAAIKKFEKGWATQVQLKADAAQ